MSCGRNPEKKKKKRKRVSMYVLVSNSTGPPTACCLGAAEIPHLFRLDPKHPFLSSRPSAAARPWYSCGAALQMGSLQSARLKITRGGGERRVFKPGWGCWERVVLSCSRGNFVEFQESEPSYGFGVGFCGFQPCWDMVVLCAAV